MRNMVSGKYHEMKGGVKVAFGKATKSRKVTLKGRAEKLAGKVEQNFGKVKKTIGR
jgi:uncharacterized protein YjbJ (UPF0337 family)